MTHVKAREWIKPMAAGRERDRLDAGCKDTLQALWDHVRWDIEREPVGDERPWVSAETIAAETGEKLGTIRDRLRKLTAAGWVRFERRAWSLAWREPWAATLVVPGATPVACDSSSGEVRLESPAGATLVTGRCNSSRTKLSHEQDIELSHEQDTAAKPARHACHPCKVEDPLEDPLEVTHASPDPDDPPRRETGQITDSTSPAVSVGADPPTSSRPRKRKPPDPKPGQTALGIPDAPEPDPVAELLAEHERLRKAAQAAHGQRQTALPSPTSDTGRSLRLRLRKAVDEHGAAVCRRALEHQAAEWARDPGALARWSTDSMWSPKSLAVSIPRSAGKARASPSRMLPVEPDAPSREYVFPWTETNT